MEKLIINLPFMGFYESWYSQELDSVEEREAENLEERDRENEVEFPLTASQYSDMLYWCADYSAAHLTIAKEYVKAFQQYLKDELDLNIALEFESMHSPKEYNFGTDRVFAYISQDDAETLYKRISKGALESTIKERHTSCSGFISSYSNDVEKWTAKPLVEWDYNELDTVLQAFLAEHANEEWEYNLFGEMAEGSYETFYSAFSDAVDWDALETKAEELRNELKEENK